MTSTDRPSQSPRRTEGKRIGGRSARVCDAVLEAAAEELGRVGFGALRMDDVATRAHVNKTTVYRRWPTKLELVSAVVERENLPPTDFDIGSLAADVRASLFELRDRLYTARQRGVLRVLLGERAVPEVGQLVRDLRAKHMSVRRRMFERATQRGELGSGIDPTLLVEFMTAPLVSRIIHVDQEVDDAYLDALTLVTCHGATAPYSRDQAPAAQ